MDRVAAFMAERTPRRALALGAFLALLYAFRHLALLLVFFVTFERALTAASTALAARTRPTRKAWVLILTALLVAALAALAWLGVGKAIRAVTEVQGALPTWIAEIEANPIVATLHDQFGGTERLIDGARHYAGSALAAVSAIGHFLVHVLIGYILALIYVLEADDLRAFWARVDPRSLFGTLARWSGHVADAAVVTVQLQLIVAVFNTVTTLPVLLLLGVPHVAALMLLIFVSALVPVIGNVVSGAILSLLAYQEQGWLGLGIFVGLTFVLHKIESYYLSPRLTARHVKIPGFLLIVSIIAAEHLFGFKGLFLAFPILFVASRLRNEWGDEDDPDARQRPVPKATLSTDVTTPTAAAILPACAPSPPSPSSRSPSPAAPSRPRSSPKPRPRAPPRRPTPPRIRARAPPPSSPPPIAAPTTASRTSSGAPRSSSPSSTSAPA